MIDAHGTVNINLPPPPRPWVWRAVVIGLLALNALMLLAIEKHLASLVKLQAIEVEILMSAAVDAPPAPSAGPYGFPPGGGNGRERLDVGLVLAADSQTIHERRGMPVVTLLGKGEDATDFRYCAVVSKDESFTIVIDRVTGGVWQCLGGVTQTTVDGKLQNECVAVYDGPVLAVKPKGKKP